MMEAEKVKTPIGPDRLKEVVQSAFKRHLLRACGSKAQAWEMTYHHLRHMGYDEVEWECVQTILTDMKNSP